MANTSSTTHPYSTTSQTGTTKREPTAITPEKEENSSRTSNLKTGSTDNLIFLENKEVITALFKNPKTAENIYEDLIRQAHKSEDIDLIMSEDTHKNHFPNKKSNASITELGNKSLEGTGVGAVVGGTVGALAAAIVAVGTSLVIPALGVVVAGPLAASFAGAGAGAAAGSLLGALVGLGLPDEQAQLLEDGIKSGGVVIRVNTRSEKKCEELHKQWLKL